MQQTMSITEVRNNFPALVRQIAERGGSIVVTNRNRPQAVLVAWETFERQQKELAITARSQLTTTVERMVKLVGAMEEIYDVGSYEVASWTQDLLLFSRQAWRQSRLLQKPYTFLAFLITNALENLIAYKEPITLEQLATLCDIIPLLNADNLTTEQGRSADIALLNVDLNAIAPIGDELAALYE